MKPPASLALLAVALGAAVAAGVAPSTDKSHKLQSVSLRKMADCLHAVIAADRAVYSRVIVERLALEKSKMAVGEDYQAADCLPVHAQMLRLAARGIQQKGAEFSYTLRSLWPINPSQGPQTEIEREGLEAVARTPGTNFYREELLGGRSYFTAIYADRATSPSCVDCHNRHASSPRSDFRTNEVMGAIVIRIPLEF